jgi:predicted nucleic acid-binding protein
VSFKILPDTSAWISFFRDASDETGLKLRKLIELEADICLCGPVVTEVLQGIRRDKDHQKISRLFELPEYLVLDRAVYEYAAEIYRGCRARGFTIRSTMDCLIAATAITQDAHLLHQDRDYESIAQFFPLKIW